MNLVYKLYNDNKPCPRMHDPPPSPLGEPELKKIGFVTPIFANSEISKPMNMLSNHGTTDAVQILNKMVPLKYPILEIG